MKKFTEIEQFRNVIKTVRTQHDYQGKDENGDAIYNHVTPYPIFRFRGTVKIHGTNSAIACYKDDAGLRYEFQSRERVLSLQQDNADFMLKMLNKNYKSLFDKIEFSESCVIYGEWSGGNIQKGVAINGLPKMFIIFAIRIDDVYQDIRNFNHLKIEEEGIYNILQFKTYSIDVDFNEPESIQNKIIELTIEVENECPVGKYFGIEGIGEGIVFEYLNENERYVFKSKGGLHSSSKNKKPATVDTEEIENLEAFIEYAVTENRLNQGIDKMKELNISIETKSTGDYLRWVVNDVIKEENDTIIANGINLKKISGAISAKARVFWLNYLNNNF